MTFDEPCPHKPRFTGTSFVFLAKFCPRCAADERAAELLARYNESRKKWDAFVASLPRSPEDTSPRDHADEWSDP